MNSIKKALKIDPQKTQQEISTFLQNRCQDLNRKGIILGLSGGLDSSLLAYLAVSSFGKEKVHALYLPDRDSKPLHKKHAQLVADSLQIPFIAQDITPSLETLGVYDSLPLKYIPGKRLQTWTVKLGRYLFSAKDKGDILHARLSTTGSEWIAKGDAYINSKHRIRMIALYHKAERQQLMVAGAANRTEWLTGTFTKWGCDHCADVMPFLHLYRSQIRALAEYMGLPEVILAKSADPDLIPGLDDKEELLGSFENVDLILYGLENGVDRNVLQDHLPNAEINKLERLMKESTHMRLSPYTLL